MKKKVTSVPVSSVPVLSVPVVSAPVTPPVVVPCANPFHIKAYGVCLTCKDKQAGK